jgi:hypothetical protein
MFGRQRDWQVELHLTNALQCPLVLALEYAHVSATIFMQILVEALMTTDLFR